MEDIKKLMEQYKDLGNSKQHKENVETSMEFLKIAGLSLDEKKDYIDGSVEHAILFIDELLKRQNSAYATFDLIMKNFDIPIVKEAISKRKKELLKQNHEDFLRMLKSYSIK